MRQPLSAFASEHASGGYPVEPELTPRDTANPGEAAPWGPMGNLTGEEARMLCRLGRVLGAQGHSEAALRMLGHALRRAERAGREDLQALARLGQATLACRASDSLEGQVPPLEKGDG
mgnify:CR=1 FL=1